jgi:Uma2 family endonuclease
MRYSGDELHDRGDELHDRSDELRDRAGKTRDVGGRMGAHAPKERSRGGKRRDLGDEMALLDGELRLRGGKGGARTGKCASQGSQAPSLARRVGSRGGETRARAPDPRHLAARDAAKAAADAQQVRACGRQGRAIDEPMDRAILASMITDPTAARPGVRMTLDHWALLDEEVRGELVDGVLVEEEVPDTAHEILVAWIIGVLHAWGRGRRVLVLGSGARLAVSGSRGRMPDVAAYLPGVPRPPLHGAIGVPPTVVVEIVSGTPRDQRRDRVEKLAEYAAFGVRWYWLVDPELRSFEVLELGPDGRYAHALAATGGVVEPVPGCEGLSLDLGAMWDQLDELQREAAGAEP